MLTGCALLRLCARPHEQGWKMVTAAFTFRPQQSYQLSSTAAVFDDDGR